MAAQLPPAQLPPRGGDSTVRTDGDDGDGQGGRFWAVQHGPLGEAPYSAPQAKKILGHKHRFTEKMSDFEWESPWPTMPIIEVK